MGASRVDCHVNNKIYLCCSHMQNQLTSLESILPRTILYVIHGSTAYGMNTETSDIDYKGIFIPTKESFFSPQPEVEHFTTAQSEGHPHDVQLYTLKKFARLAAAANPTILEVLFIDSPNHIVIDSAEARRLKTNRNLFLSRKVYSTYCGYVYQQIKLMQARHKSPPDASNAERRAQSWKNAAHVIRLMRMCVEILSTGTVDVYRHTDRDELLAIRQGRSSLEEVMQESEHLRNEAGKSLNTSPLPKEPDHIKINALITSITSDYLKAHP